MTVPKFRAWDALARKMIRELLLISYVRNEIIGKYENGSNSNPLKIREEVILMQSTGLVDKNGQEIFEGDIVHAYSEDARLIGTIEYFDNAYCIKTKNGVYNSHWTNAEYYEVIGNIYENPELLEEETNDQ